MPTRLIRPQFRDRAGPCCNACAPPRGTHGGFGATLGPNAGLAGSFYTLDEVTDEPTDLFAFDAALGSVPVGSTCISGCDVPPSR